MVAFAIFFQKEINSNCMVENVVTYTVRIQGKLGCHGCVVSLPRANSLTAVGKQSMLSTKADATG